MARRKMPTIPDDKIHYFSEQLYRELAHMFEWEGLPKTVPHDYLERNLVRGGHVLFYDNEDIGLDVIACSVVGHNRHNMPTQANATIPGTTGKGTYVSRNIRRLTDSENIVEEFDSLQDGILISNMAYGESCKDIVDYFAYRMASAQQAFDTNMLWQNRPYIFPVDGQDTRLSLEKLFEDVESGRPFTITDKSLLYKEDELGIRIDVPYIADKIMDTLNELKMKFKQTIGIDTAGVDKAERVLDGEIKANEQGTKNVLQIMLEQRQIAAENINAFYGLNVSVDVIKPPEQEEMKEGEEVGAGDNGAEAPPTDE